MGSEIPGACEPPSPTLTTHFSSAASTGVRDDVGLFEVVKLGHELSQSGRGAAGSIAVSVTHRTTVHRHHNTHLELLGEGRWRLGRVEEGEPAGV